VVGTLLAIGQGTVKRQKPGRVVLVGESPDWQGELGLLLTHEGYATDRVPRLDAVVPLLAGGSVQALFVAALPLAASDLLLVRRIREVSPRTAVVAVTRTPTDPDLKRAFESGATAFLSWPASTEALRQAIDRRAIPADRSSRPSRFPDSPGGTPK